MTSAQILETLIGFDTVSRNSNIALMRYIETLLGADGITATLIPNQDGSKANLLATIEPGATARVLCCLAILMLFQSRDKTGPNSHSR